MSSRKEKAAFRRLKHIERRLASIKYEKKWVERKIRRINNPKFFVLIAAASTFGASILTYIGLVLLSYSEDREMSSPIYTAGVIVFVFFILFALLTLIAWETREKTDMRLTDTKRGMKSALKEMEREKEEIFRHYPALRERKIKVRFALEPYRLVQLLSVISTVVLIGLFLISPPEEHVCEVFALLNFLLIMSIQIPEVLRVKKYTMQNKQNRRKALTPDIVFETEEKYDIMQYKRV